MSEDHSDDLKEPEMENISSMPCIIPVSPADLHEIYTLECAGQLYPWTRENLSAELSARHAFHFVMRLPVPDQIVAFVLNMLIIDELHIHSICVASVCRRCGYARRLLIHALDAARGRGGVTAFLEVRSDNRAAIALYTELGFAIEMTRKQYYQTGEDALLMRKKL